MQKVARESETLKEEGVNLNGAIGDAKKVNDG